MNCDDFRRLFHGYIDGRSSKTETDEIEMHARDCNACAQSLKNTRAVALAVRGANLSYKAPEHLRRNIEVLASRRSSRPARFWRPMLAAAALVALVIAAWSTLRVTDRVQNEALMREVVSSHVRSLMAGHLADVASADGHTVKPWFSGKLSFSPRVDDFVEKNFTLVGGRLDYVAETPVAALVYQRRKHLINVFTWPVSDPPSIDATAARRGYNIMHWTGASGMTYWAISDINAKELQELGQLIQEKDPPK